MIQDKGLLGWQTAVGYGRRSLEETAMFRDKAVIGRGLRARTLPAQKTEARVGCSVLNRMTRLGMPVRSASPETASNDPSAPTTRIAHQSPSITLSTRHLGMGQRGLIQPAIGIPTLIRPRHPPALKC